MNVRINGTEKRIDEGTTVEGLLAALDIGLSGIAVDLNREIVPRRMFKETLLKEGDSVEIVRMAGGG